MAKTGMRRDRNVRLESVARAPQTKSTKPRSGLVLFVRVSTHRPDAPTDKWVAKKTWEPACQGHAAISGVRNAVSLAMKRTMRLEGGHDVVFPLVRQIFGGMEIVDL